MEQHKSFKAHGQEKKSLYTNHIIAWLETSTNVVTSKVWWYNDNRWFQNQWVWQVCHAKETKDSYAMCVYVHDIDLLVEMSNSSNQPKMC